MSCKPLVLGCLGAFVLLVSLPAIAATDKDSAQKLTHIEQQLSAQRAAAEKVEQKAAEATAALAALREKLITATKALQDKQDEQNALEDKLDHLEKQMKERGRGVEAAQARLRVLTGAFVRLARLPPAFFLFQGGSVTDHVHRAIALRALLPPMRDEAARLADEMLDLEGLRRTTAEQKRLVIAARQNLEWQRANLDSLVKARQGYVQKTVEEKEAIAAQLNALADEAKDLRQLLDKVNQRALALPKARDAAPPLRSDLRLPVAGRIVRDFGVRDDYGLASQGLTISAAPSAPVVAPQAGRVVFVGPFRGYGQIVILQHTGGAHSFMAGFGRIDAEMGQAVDAGEPLGILPAKGKDGNSPPDMYFEWRIRGEPANPRAVGR